MPVLPPNRTCDSLPRFPADSAASGNSSRPRWHGSSDNARVPGLWGKAAASLLSVEIRDFRDPAAELPHACSQQDAAHACCERRVSCTRYTCCCFMKILLFEKNDKKHYCDNCRNESARKKARHPRIRHDTLRAAAKGRRILALHEKHQARRNAVHLAIREAMGILRYCLS